ncbi:MAG: hypothetical protein HYX21_01585 [Candidatus Yanofskybacteria bacterium]|nr:hypothetical protein [Candidatus Yanofskybacteria bacterium]
MFKRHWQFKGALVLAALNVDVWCPVLRWLGVGPWKIFFVLLPTALVGMLGWWAFWHWFRRKAIPEIIEENAKMQEAIKLGKKTHQVLKISGQWNLIVKFAKSFSKATDPNNRLIKWVKRYGHLAVFGLGAEPLPALRTLCLIFCDSIGWRGGIYTLIFSDILHVAVIVWGWNKIFSLLGY